MQYICYQLQIQNKFYNYHHSLHRYSTQVLLIQGKGLHNQLLINHNHHYKLYNLSLELSHYNYKLNIQLDNLHSNFLECHQFFQQQLHCKCLQGKILYLISCNKLGLQYNHNKYIMNLNLLFSQYKLHNQQHSHHKMIQSLYKSQLDKIYDKNYYKVNLTLNKPNKYQKLYILNIVRCIL